MRCLLQETENYDHQVTRRLTFYRRRTTGSYLGSSDDNEEFVFPMNRTMEFIIEVL